MQITRPEPLEYRENVPRYFRLVSDPHIGSPETDYKLIGKELKLAREKNARVLVNGDVFDGIIPKDHKRYVPTAVHKRLRGRDDVINAAVEWAYEILGDYADLIDVIGIGNHESSLEKYHSVNPVKLLCDKLKVPYGGYSGFVDYRFRDSRGGGTRWVIYYHHGNGGGSGLGAAAADFSKKLSFVDADLIWLGHRHHRILSHMRRIHCPMVGDRIKYRDVHYVMSGAYMDTLKNGMSYAELAGYPPQGKGGAEVSVTLDRRRLVHTEISL